MSLQTGSSSPLSYEDTAADGEALWCSDCDERVEFVDTEEGLGNPPREDLTAAEASEILRGAIGPRKILTAAYLDAMERVSAARIRTL